MNIVLAGLSHKSASVALREALAAVGVPTVLERLAAEGWEEMVVLSTCNRFELYTSTLALPSGEDPAGTRNSVQGAATYNDVETMRQLLEFMENLCGQSLGQVVYQKSGQEAIHHLFSVSAGLDSLVVGEAEILGQVKQAYEISRQMGRTGKSLNTLFQRALYVGKLVRSHTGISTGQTSVASVAVQLAQKIFGSLSESQVLILGAGKMAELSAKHLLSGNVKRLLVSNRTREKGVALAQKFDAEAVRWEAFPQLLEQVDIVIASTGSARPILTSQLLGPVLSSRRGRSLFLIDIAMPRDVEESVCRLEHVYLYTLEDLKEIVEENVSKRREEFAGARVLVEEELLKFCERDKTRVSYVEKTQAGDARI
ncbi:MAG: glutamyl-tRNA reductase [Elusimicrobia bacterium]|nr:glutamyl-tRNA reductase [Elusimicrobiota bacterium]